MTGMASIETLLTDHLDVWTSAIARKSSAGRGRSRKFSLHGIEKLRSLILDLAVRGKLVPQDPSDESATILLRRFRAENIDWIEKKRMRKGKQLPPVHVEDIRYKAPYGWSWIRLNQLGDWGAGATPNRKRSDYYGGGIPWFKSGELTSDIISISEESVTDLALEECSLRLNRPGDVLIAMYGATIGKTSILAVEATTNQAVCACTPFAGASNRYLLMALKAMRPLFVGQGAGGAQPNISREKIIATAFALPPESEQHRIVAKVDELMALCDRLEADTYAAIEAHRLLVTELLATLTASRDAGELAENWARIETHFDTLFVTEDSVDQLKQTILQLAVSGRLVPQDPKDEPASELISRIRAEKSKRVADGNSKKSRYSKMDNLLADEFEIPENWVWTTFAELATKITDGAHHTPTYVDEGIPFLSVKDMSGGKLDFSDTRFVLEEEHLQLYSRCNPEMGDLLITKVGTTGVPVIVDTEQEFSLFVSVALIKAPWSLLSVEYLQHLVASPFVRRQSADGTQGIGNKNLVLKTIAGFTLPLPPLAEQFRIVAKIDELTTVCDTLKSELRLASDQQKYFGDTIFAKAVA